MKNILKEFRTFLLRGNVVDLAVGVIVGGMFNQIVSSFANDIIVPIIGIFFSAKDMSSVVITIGSSSIMVGNFLASIINFVITGFGVFVIVKVINTFQAGFLHKKAADAPTTKKCPYCQSEISIAATRCPNCTSELSA